MFKWAALVVKFQELIKTVYNLENYDSVVSQCQLF